MNEEINPADCHEADEIERAAEQVLKTAARGNDRPLRRDVTIEDIEDAVALVRLKDATRFAARKIRNQRNCINNLDARNKELNVRLDESKSNTFTEEDREMLTKIYGKKKDAQLAQTLGGKRGAILAKAKKTSDDPRNPTTEMAAKWVLSKKETGDTRSQNAVIKDAANKFGFTEAAVKQAVIRTKKRQGVPESVSPKDAKKLIAACKVLGCNPTDRPESIKSRYRQLAKTLHPDTSKKDGSQFKAVSKAWKTASEILGIE